MFDNILSGWNLHYVTTWLLNFIKGYIIMLHHSEQNSTTDDGSQQEDWET